MNIYGQLRRLSTLAYYVRDEMAYKALRNIPKTVFNAIIIHQLLGAPG